MPVLVVRGSHAQFDAERTLLDLGPASIVRFADPPHKPRPIYAVTVGSRLILGVLGTSIGVWVEFIRGTCKRDGKESVPRMSASSPWFLDTDDDGGGGGGGDDEFCEER